MTAGWEEKALEELRLQTYLARRALTGKEALMLYNDMFFKDLFL